MTFSGPRDQIYEHLLRASSYEPGQQDKFCLLFMNMGNLNPVTEMKNVQKDPKIPVELRFDLSATLKAMRT